MEVLRCSPLWENEGNARRLWLLKKEIKSFVMAGILIGYFTLAWTPYIIFEFLSLRGDVCMDKYVR